MRSVALVARPIDPGVLIAQIASVGYGAISLFAGSVRDTNDGRAVTAIDYSAYSAMAESELEQIVTEAEVRFGVSSVIVEHRTGLLSLGEISVAIVAAHPHRGPALDCTRYVIEEIKKRVPIWKMEHYGDGTREWVDPTKASGVASGE
ncbi:MAG: molybdenum cofactor biosynthesis protein MoaE [Gemmatimonadota bacterium]|nr:molybdenum cofactor biosynthesis protein MoaE [Gemmatimonadota bacterium]